MNFLRTTILGGTLCLLPLMVVVGVGKALKRPGKGTADLLGKPA